MRSKAVKYAVWESRWYWWIATYAVSRPFAVDSQMSSAAATRTSIGNGMRAPEMSIQSRSRRITSTTFSRGTAYSDSRKTTLRSEQNTLYDASTYSRADNARDATWLMRGTRPGRLVA